MQKKITLDLTSIDGNAYMLLGSFKTQAHREKWTPQEIEAVLSEAIKGDYDHLVVTLAKHCESEEDQIDDEPYSVRGADNKSLKTFTEDEFYVDVEGSDFGVFGTESGFCYSLWSSREDAEKDAKERTEMKGP